VPDAPLLAEWSQLAWREADPAAAVERWPLTPAELRLLHFMPTHLSFREIAEQLVVSANTVKTQAQAIYRKLGVSSRAEAVACAEAAGLIEHRDVPGRAAP
jgi:LuxR family transcriptional regulator, maltose regulon positive regulatory protein